MIAALLLGVVAAPAGAQLATAMSTPRLAPPASNAAAPLTLRALLDSVRAGYPLVQAAHARVRAARGARTTAGVLGNPSLALQVENAPLPGRAAPPMDREVMTTATLPLEPLYQRSPRVRAANAQVRAARADAAATSLQVALDAARTYYRTALAQVSVEAARNVAGWLDTVVAYNRTRVREGVAAESDLIRSELERDRAVAEATMQEADLARARAELGAFLGPSAPLIASVGTLTVAVESAPLPVPESMRDMARGPPGAGGVGAAGRARARRGAASRPDVVAARERLGAAGAAVTSERVMILRELGATVGTKQTAGTTSLVAGISLPFPLFDQNRGEVARASAEREAAAFELAASERNARAEVAGAYEAARLLSERASLLARADSDGTPAYLARADEARRIALGAYREGAVPLLTVIDAARAWAEARVMYHRLIFAQHESVVALLTAAGVEPSTALSRSTDGERP